MKKNNGKITLGELANMIARGFENTATKEDIKEVNNRIDAVDVGLTSVEKKVDKLDYQVDEAYDILILEKTVRAIASQMAK